MLPKITDCGESSSQTVLEDVSSDEESDDTGIHTDSSEAGSEIDEEDDSDPDLFMNNDCAMPCMHQVNNNTSSRILENAHYQLEILFHDFNFKFFFSVALHLAGSANRAPPRCLPSVLEPIQHRIHTLRAPALQEIQQRVRRLSYAASSC